MFGVRPLGEGEIRQLTEAMTFRQLLNYSDPKRVARSKHVRGPSLKLDTAMDSNAYHFNFRSYPSTQKQRHVGYVKFNKPTSDKADLFNLSCSVDCTCKDFRYRFSWANKQRGASSVGPGSLNKALNRAPRITNPTNRPGLCIAEGELVSTKHGLIPIENVGLGECVWTLQGWKKVTASACTGIKSTVEVELASGNKIRLTPEHQVLAFDDVSGFRWTAANDLSSGTHLCNAPPPNFETEVEAFSVEPYKGGTLRYTGGVVRADETLAELLGYMASEGALGLFCNTNQVILDDFATKWRQLFGPESVIVRNGTGCYIGVHGTRILEELGFKFGSYAKVVPPCVMRSGRSAVIAFLRGAYAGDGNFLNRHSTYASVSEELARPIHLLLGALGIRSSIQLYHTGINSSPTWYVRTSSGEETARLYKLLNPIRGYSSPPVGTGTLSRHGCVLKRPTKLIRSILQRTLPVCADAEEVLLTEACPRGMLDWVAKQLKAAGQVRKKRLRNGGKPNNVARRCDVEGVLREYRINKIMTALKLPNESGWKFQAKKLKPALAILADLAPDAYKELKILDQDVTYDEIKTVRPYKVVKVYDLTVEDAEHFTVNGVIVHNCKHIIAVKDYLAGILYTQPKTLTAPERLGRLVTLTNRSVINPKAGNMPAKEVFPGGKVGGEAEPPITAPAGFHGSPAQNPAPRGPSRGRAEEPSTGSVASARRAEKDAAASRAALARGEPAPLPGGIPGFKDVRRLSNKELSRLVPPPLPSNKAPGLKGIRDLPKRELSRLIKVGNDEKNRINRQNQRRQTDSVVNCMKIKPIFEEIDATLDATEDGLGSQEGIIGILSDIRDTLKELVGGEAGGEMPAGDKFELPANAEKLDLVSGEEEEEDEGLPDASRGLPDEAKLDIEAESPEGAEGDSDEEDTVD